MTARTYHPQFPVYVISKGRSDLRQHTAVFLQEDGVEHRIVVEPQEADAYAERFGADRLLILPFSNLGLGGIPARNFCWEHALEAGADRHWILDDNIQQMERVTRGRRHRVSSAIALDCAEEFTLRYTNVAITGFDYFMFCRDVRTPFRLNNHVYSCLLIRNDLPYRWRGRYNEDTDLCLQVLSGKWCTVQITAFCIHKTATMQTKGGNTDELYKGDGRLRMARSLEEQWPGIVTTVRRFNRPQHKVAGDWKFFDHPLIRRDDLDFEAIASQPVPDLDLRYVGRKGKGKRQPLPED